jgi:hypothetical protein
MLTRDEETLISVKIAYARMFNRIFSVEIRGIAVTITPHSKLGTVKEVWKHHAIRRAREAAEKAGAL